MSIERRLAVQEEIWAQDGGADPVAVPAVGNVIEFCVEVLGWVPYPAQALVLKIMAGATDLLTDADLELLDRWASGYSDVNAGHFTGTSGTTPDIRQRLAMLNEQQRWSFRQVVLVLGRRAGKSQLTAVMILWTMWRLICLGDPQAHFGIPDRKAIHALTFSTDRDAVTRTVFGDIKRMVEGSPTLRSYLATNDKYRLAFYTPRQLGDGDRQKNRSGSLVVEAASANAVAARGLSLIALAFDEAAFIDGSGSTDDCAEIMEAAAPALTQFENEAITILASSPATRVGRFFEAHQHACAVDAATSAAVNPDIVMIHQPSWFAYEGWEAAHELEMFPGGRHYPRFTRAILTADSPEVLDARRNDDRRYRVEYLAEWADVLNPFLPRQAVENIFAPFQGRRLEHRTLGDVRHGHFVHVDPSKNGSNTAITVAHVEHLDDGHHLVFDFIDAWSPSDFADGHINYQDVVNTLVALRQDFRPVSMTIDSYGGHVVADWFLEKVGNRAGMATLQPVSAHTHEKLSRYDRFRTLALAGYIHAPDHDLARLELSFLQQEGNKVGKPSTGPCRTDDIADAMAWTTHLALGPNSNVAEQFTDLHARGGRYERPPNEYAEAFSRARSHQPAAYNNPARGTRLR